MAIVTDAGKELPDPQRDFFPRHPRSPPAVPLMVAKNNMGPGRPQALQSAHYVAYYG